MSSIALISCGADLRTKLSGDFLSAIASRLSSWNDLDFYEGEGDCTSETGAGQFSIFGAIEEKTCHGFSRIATDQGTGEERRVEPLDGGSFPKEAEARGKSGRVGSRNIHRGRTGNAERQYSVLGT